jgi:endonuclease YncB( thermonuclease family)
VGHSVPSGRAAIGAALAAVTGLLLMAPGGMARAAEVIEVIDGDTLDTDEGQVTLIGIDAPETGTCEAEAARLRLVELIEDQDVPLVAGAQGDVDADGFLLRYAHVAVPDEEDIDGSVDGMLDVGAALVAEGYAVARYDSRDGYGPHKREAAYIALDESSEPFVCDAEQLTVFQTPTTVTTLAAIQPAVQLEPQSVYFENCDAARAAGAAPVHVGDPGYSSKLDRDGDGVGCEN